MRRLLPVLLATLLLAGCSGSSGSSGSGSAGAGSDGGDGGTTSATSGTPAPPSAPECDSIWKAGRTLPADYAGCAEDGANGTEETVECKDGTRLVAYDDTFYARTGGRIVEPELAPMQDTDEFSAAYADCTGD
jgi:hypothetical protein